MGADVKVQPTFIQVRAKDGWVTLCRYQISELQNMPGGLVVRMSSGMPYILNTRQGDALLKILGIKEGK